MRLNRRAFLAASGGVALAGCVGQRDPDGGGETPTTAAPTETDAVEQGGEHATPTGEATPTDEPTASPTPIQEASNPTVPVADERLTLPMGRKQLRDEARSGGPPKDGIPSIDAPTFVEPKKAPDYLGDGDVVFGLERNGVAKAYPQKILVYHEIVNDAIDGTPVSVTYCPLTGTAMGFERGDTTFGVSGRLVNNNLVMYDRGNQTWWPQILASSIPGPWNANPAANSLREFRVVWTTWKRWRDLHPDTVVLSDETGSVRNYGSDPYGAYNPKSGYYKQSSTLFPKLNPDDSYHAKRVFIGTRNGDGAAAFLKDSLRDQQTMTGELAGEPIVAVYDERLDTGYVYHNPEVKSVTVDGETATLGGSTHDPDALPLDRAYAFDAMWFAWHGFYPGTTVYE